MSDLPQREELALLEAAVCSPDGVSTAQVVSAAYGAGPGEPGYSRRYNRALRLLKQLERQGRIESQREVGAVALFWWPTPQNATPEGGTP